MHDLPCKATQPGRRHDRVFGGVLAAWLTVCALVNAQAMQRPFQHRAFAGAKSVFVVGPSGVLAYTPETESMRRIATGGSDAGIIHDVVEDEGLLWVLSDAGLFTLDKAGGTVQSVPFPLDTLPAGRLAVDWDYVWLGSDASLWQFDKLGMEWLEIPLPPGRPDTCGMRGMHSDGETVYCVSSCGVYVLSVGDEKWREYPLDGFRLSPSAVSYSDDAGLTLVDHDGIYRFVFDVLQWETVVSGEEVLEARLLDERLVCLTKSRAFEYQLSSSFSRDFVIPMLGDAQAFTVSGDTLSLVSPGALIAYNMDDQSWERLPGPGPAGEHPWSFALKTGGAVIVLGDGDARLYDPTMEQWRPVPVSGGTAGRRRFAWDDEGMRVVYDGERRSVLSGRVEAYYTDLLSAYRYDTLLSRISVDTVVVSPDSVRLDTTITALLDSASRRLVLTVPERPDIRADLDLHTDFGNNRYLDIFFDRSSIRRPVDMGARYQGDRTDNVSRVTLGNVDIDNASSPLVPDVHLRGGNAVVQSRARLTERDRARVRSVHAGGAIVSSTRWATLDYSPLNTYTLDAPQADSTVRIVPGSLRLWVDGEELEENDFTFVARIYQLSLLRPDIADPSSVITVSYEVETTPDEDIARVELVPDHDFGHLAYSSGRVAVSPWLSAEAGYLALDRDRLEHVVLAGVPVELRPEGNSAFLLKADPRYAYNTASGTSAGALSLRSRVGSRTSVLFDGTWADREFMTTDTLSRGYGALQGETDATVAFDIVKEAPVSYRNYWMHSTGGSRLRHEVTAGLHFPKFPFVDIELARDDIDAVVLAPGDTAARPLERRKDRLRVSLRENSSPWVEQLLHINRLKYELTYTEYRSTDHVSRTDSRGRSLYGTVDLLPVSNVLLKGSGFYFGNPDGSQLSSNMGGGLSLQMTDAPPGLDVAGGYRTNLARFGSADTSLALIDRGLQVIVKPGSWWRRLGWLSPRAGLWQTITCAYPTLDPGGRALIAGDTHRESYALSRNIGVHVFPVAGLLYKNDNIWADDDSSGTFATSHWMQWVLGDKGRILAAYDYETDRSAVRVHEGSAGYARTWLSWLRTREQVRIGYATTDTTAAVASVAPSIDVYLSVRNWRFVHRIDNRHTCALEWHYQDGAVDWSPDLVYVFDLVAVLAPNITLQTVNTVSVRGGAFELYEGDFAVKVTF